MFGSIEPLQKTLFSTMESVVSMMREVELKEQVAGKAKEDSFKEDTDVLDKVEELKQMLQNAKEANDMVVILLLGS